MKVTWPLRTAPLAAAGAGGRAATGAPARPEDRDYATALGPGGEALDRPDPELDEEERAAAALIRFHHLANRPEPASFPRVALRLLDLVLDEDVQLEALCRQVELDAAVAGAVLARANTAAGRALDPIETVRHAVTRIGLSEVARVAASTALRSLYDERVQAGFSAFVPVWPVLFRHAVVSGRLAAELARGRQDASPDAAFMLGLLHDVGLAVAMRSLTALTLDGTLPLREPASALRLLRQAHVELGAEAARAWRLPRRLLEAVERHHEPGLPAEPALAPLHLVRVASAIDLLHAAPGADGSAAREAVDSARALGGTPAWLAAAVARRDDAEGWARRALSEP